MFCFQVLFFLIRNLILIKKHENYVKILIKLDLGLKIGNNTALHFGIKYGTFVK